MGSERQEGVQLAVRAGRLLLENGAEVSRVQDTIGRMLRALSMADHNIYIVANGIFVTVGEGGEQPCHSVRYVRAKGIHMGRIVAVNDLSRKLEAGSLSREEFRRELDGIEAMPLSPLWLRLLGCGISAAAFSLLLGGSWRDGCAAFVNGFLLQIFLAAAAPRSWNKFVVNIVGGAVVTALTALYLALGLPLDLDKTIIGSIIPLVPGLMITTSIRDLLNSDYLSGVTHLADALIVAMSVAVGVGTVLTLWSRVGGAI